MNKKGFSLIEVVVTLAVISLITTIGIRSISSSMSLGKKEAYQLMKNNIISSGYTYIEECTQGLISCDFSFENQNTFKASILKEKGYFKDLKSPIDGIDLGQCLSLTAKKENGVTVIDIIDDCYR